MKKTKSLKYLMSSSRSVASARAKRAGMAEPMKPNYASQINVQNNNNQPSMDKLSIPHAITLATLRIGKLETYVQKLESEILPTIFNSPMFDSIPSENNSNETPVKSNSIDESFMKNLEERFNHLHKKIQEVERENSILKYKLENSVFTSGLEL